MKELLEEFRNFANKEYDSLVENYPTNIDEWIEAIYRISNKWDVLCNDCTAKYWYEGNKIIAETIGTIIMYWDTDTLDQLDFIDRLVALVDKRKHITHSNKGKCLTGYEVINNTVTIPRDKVTNAMRKYCSKNRIKIIRV